VRRMEIGDKVKWIVNIDEVYSSGTKSVVGTIGEIIEPMNRHSSSKYYNNAPGCFDVKFPYGQKEFLIVWDIPYCDLEPIP